MALPICEFWVINLTVSWKGFIPISTFNSENLILLQLFKVGLTQSAGNLAGSPEAIREKSSKFFSFHIAYQAIYDKKIPDAWLEWFIGFVEGDGALLFNKSKKSCCFVLTQKEKAILEHIQETLNFGRVRQFSVGNGYSRYLVGDKPSIILLSHLFNGNLVLPHRQKQLSV